MLSDAHICILIYYSPLSAAYSYAIQRIDVSAKIARIDKFTCAANEVPIYYSWHAGSDVRCPRDCFLEIVCLQNIST